MNSFSLLKDFITIDNEKYYHYELGGKWNATKFVVINGVHYYNQPPLEINLSKVRNENG